MSPLSSASGMNVGRLEQAELGVLPAQERLHAR